MNKIIMKWHDVADMIQLLLKLGYIITQALSSAFILMSSYNRLHI